MASTTAVASPDRAVGSTTFHTVRHWLEPEYRFYGYKTGEEFLSSLSAIVPDVVILEPAGRAHFVVLVGTCEFVGEVSDVVLPLLFHRRQCIRGALSGRSVAGQTPVTPSIDSRMMSAWPA